MRSMLGCRVIHDLDGLVEVSQAWDSLVLRCEFPDIFATSGFARAWWRAYGESRILRVVVVEDGKGTVRLIAPFYSDKSSPNVWRLIGNFRADYNNLIYAADDRESLPFFFTWMQRQRDWESLELTRVPGNASILHYFHSAYGPDASRWRKTRSWLALRGPLVYRTWQNIHPHASGEFLAKLEGLLEHRNYKRNVNWFCQRGTLEYLAISEPAKCLEYLPAFIDLHIARWQASGERSLFLNSEDRRFYQLMIEELAPYNAIRLDMLTFNGRMIAAHFGFTWRKRVYCYKSCYDVALSDRRPGMLLLAYMIRRAIAEGATEVDLLMGREAYKDKFASDIRTTGSLFVHRSRVSVLLAHSTVQKLGNRSFGALARHVG